MKADFRAALLALLFLAACDGGGDDTGGDDTGGDDTGNDTDSGDTGGSGTLITAAAGGTVTSPDGKMTLDIPAGALSADTTITIEVVPQASWPNIVTYLQPITAVYRLGPDGTTFSTPAIATFDIDSASVDTLYETITDPFEPDFDGIGVPSAWLHDGENDPEGAGVSTTIEDDGTATAEVEVPHFTDVFVSHYTLNGRVAFHQWIGPPYERQQGETWAAQAAMRSDAFPHTYWVRVDGSGVVDVAGNPGTSWAVSTTAPYEVGRRGVPVNCVFEGTGRPIFTITRDPFSGSDYRELTIRGPEVTCLPPGPRTCRPERELDPTGWSVIHVTDAASDALESQMHAWNGCQAVVSEVTSSVRQVLVDTSAWGARRADDYVLVSGDGEGAGTDDSYAAVLSADGRRGVFLTQADDLLGQTTGTEAAILFAVDPDDGLPTLERFARTPATHRESYPAISGDGRWVAFNDHTSNTWILDADTPSSTAVQLPSGLFPVVDRRGANVAVSYYYNDGASFPYQIEVIDLDADRDGETLVEQASGTFGTNHRITRSTTGAYCNGTQGHTRALGLSETGRFVLYSSDATNLTTDTVPAEPHLFLHDRDADDDWLYDETGAGETTTEVASKLPNGTIVASPSLAGQRWLSDDARYAVFQTYDLSGSGGDHAQVYVRDLVNGTTALVTATSGGAPANGNSFGPLISPDGSTIALVTTATDLPGVPAPSPSVAVVGPNPLYTAP